MKNLRFYLFLAFMAMFSLAVTSCANKGGAEKEATEESTDAEVDKTGKEYTSAFICPSHCKGSGSDEAGKCPVCGMDYVVNEDHNADGHSHDEDGEDHNHDHGDDHEGHNH